MKKAIALLFVSLFVFAAAASADVETKFYGYQWLRYDYKFTGMTPASNGFYVPRTYLRWKFKDFDMGYEANITIDVNNVSGGESVNANAVTYTATTVKGAIDWGAWVKHGYIVLNKVPLLQDVGAALKIGIQPVYFGIIDTWWSPLIERAPEDRRCYMYAADNGIAITGKLPEKWGGYEAAVYNGAGYKNLELNMEKAYLASLLVSPIEEFYIRVSYYMTMLNNVNETALPFNSTAVVAGGKIGDVDGFFEYVVKNSGKDAIQEKPGIDKSGTGEIYSVYINYNLLKAFSIMARYDMWDPDTFVRKDEVNTFIAGVNFKIAGDAILLQLNYQLDAAKFKGSNVPNANLWAAQVKWSW